MAKAKAKARQCIILPGAGVRILQGRSATGFPCFTIFPTSDSSAKRFDKEDGLHTNPTSSWAYDEVSKDKAIITFSGTKQWDEPEHSLETLSEPERLDRLRQKINDRWHTRATHLELHHETWAEQPETFYGIAQDVSVLLYSFQSVLDAKHGQHQERRIQHICRLAREVDVRTAQAKSTNAEYLESTCKQVLFTELWTNAGRKAETNESDRRTFEYAIADGRTINTIDTHYPGFRLALAPLLSRRKYAILFSLHAEAHANVIAISFDLVRRHLEPPLRWVDPQVLQKVVKYQSASQAVGEYLWQIAGLSTCPRKRPRMDMDVGYAGQNSPWQHKNHGRHESETVLLEGTMEMAIAQLSHISANAAADTDRGTYFQAPAQTNPYLLTSLDSVVPVRGPQASPMSDFQFVSPIQLNQYENANYGHSAPSFVTYSTS